MHIPEPLKFTIGGFSAKRVGYVLAVASFALVPAHFYVSCEMSGLTFGSGLILFLASSVLSFVIPRGTPHRFHPMALGFIAVVAHMLCTH